MLPPINFKKWIDDGKDMLIVEFMMIELILHFMLMEMIR